MTGAPIMDVCDVAVAFWRATEAHSDRTAIVENGHAISYASLMVRVRQVAADLGPECGVVGVLVSRSVSTIVALLGVLVAGGTYCPIDPTFPVERQKAIARSSGCRTIIDVSGVPLAFHGLRSVDAQGRPPYAPANPEVPVVAAAAECPAYILFTSGSTGESKPVVTSRRAISTVVESLRALLQIDLSDRVLQFASLNWDTCFEEILPALTSGAALIIDDDAYAGSVPRLLRMLEREQVTVVDLPTAYWHELVHFLAEGRVPLPAALRLVVIGGEAARPKRLADWCSLDTARIRLVNTYGCTETTLVTHSIDLHGPCAAWPGMHWVDGNEVPIGRSLPHVIEQIGESGELLIGGPALAQGYLGSAELTAARFRTLEFGGGEQRYFLTGDRVLRSSTGELLHRGRLDGQLKVRGIRIDPGEVESEISGHAAVAAVAVVGVSVADHTTMIAYVVPRQGANVETLAKEIVAYLRQRVPAHIVPSQLRVVPELVHTPSGKIDRAASHIRHSRLTRARSSGNEC